MAIFPGSAIPSAAEDYTIDQSVRIEKGSVLTKTFASDGDRTAWTWSGWTKNAFDWSSTADNALFSAIHPSGAASGRFNAYFRGELPGNYFEISQYGGSYTTQVATNASYRDPGAWLHVVVVWDSDNGVEADRARIYINGERITSLLKTNYPSSGEESSINDDACVQAVGAIDGVSDSAIASYLAEVYFIDGQALDADSFGETDSDTNQWKPKDASGLTFGTNGFYLKFQDSAALGDDSSGNTNDFAVTNLVASDQLLDSPTNNFCTWNGILGPDSSARVPSPLSEGNLKATQATDNANAFATLGMASGKWYAENLGTSVAGDSLFMWGFSSLGGGSNSSLLQYASGQRKSDGGGETSGWATTLSNDDIMMWAYDADAGKVWYGVNGSWYNSGNPAAGTNEASTGVTAPGLFIISTGSAAGSTSIANFGQDSSFAGNETAQGNQDSNEIGDFYYTPPTDFLTLCTSNLDDPSIALPGDNFNTVLYTGNGSTQSITGVGFQPDIVWIKDRTATESHMLYDAVRGAEETIMPNQTAIEFNTGDRLSSFDSDGFSLGNNDAVNKNTDAIVSWNWLAGGTPTADNDNTTGAMDANSVALNGSLQAAYTPSGSPSIYPSKMSINTINGFSIISYTSPDSSSDETIPHGLSQAPDMVIVKNLDTTYNWDVWTPDLQSGYDLRLNTTDAETASRWSTTDPSASLITLKDTYEVNGTDDYVAYCFHSVEGYSKVGSYTGNGNADGPFGYIGFRPSFVLIKSTSSGTNWMMFDSKREGYNVDNDALEANTTDAESTTDFIDMVSNGFKVRNSHSDVNTSTHTYIYLAFAAYPFKFAPAR